MVELFGGPGRDRTDDLFHAMLRVQPYVIDGAALMSWQNRQNWHNRQYLLPKCCQKIHLRAIGLCCGRAARLMFLSCRILLENGVCHLAFMCVMDAQRSSRLNRLLLSLPEGLRRGQRHSAGYLHGLGLPPELVTTRMTLE